MNAVRMKKSEGEGEVSNPHTARPVPLVRWKSTETRVGVPSSEAMPTEKGHLQDETNEPCSLSSMRSSTEKAGGTTLRPAHVSADVTDSFRAQRQQAIEDLSSDCHDSSESDDDKEDELPGAVAVYNSFGSPDDGSVDDTSSRITDVVGTTSSAPSRVGRGEFNDSTLTVEAHLVDETEQVMAHPAPDDKYLEQLVQRRVVRKLFKYGLCGCVLVVIIVAAAVALGVYFGVSRQSTPTAEDRNSTTGAGSSPFSASDLAERNAPTPSPTDDSEDSEDTYDFRKTSTRHRDDGRLGIQLHQP